MLFILNREFKSVGVLNNKSPKGLSYYNDIYSQAIENNLSTFEFEVPANHPSSSLLEVEGFILYTDIDDKKQLFEIKEITDTHNEIMTKSIYCEHTAVSDLVGTIIRPVSMSGWTLENAVTHVLNSTGWTLGSIPFNGVKGIEFDSHITALEALHTILKEFEVEMEYEVKFNGTQVTNKVINIVSKRGLKTGKIFEYKKDLLEVQKVIDSRSLITALIGVGKDGLSLTGFQFADDDPRFKYVNDYVYDLEAFQRWNKNGKHIFGVFEDDNIANQVNLYQATKAKLKELSTPKSTYTCSLLTLERLTKYSHEKVRIGDTILVKDFEYSPPMLLEARVIDLKRSETDPSQDGVVLGDYVELDFTKSDEIAKIQKIIRQNQKAWDEELEAVKGDVTYKVELHSSNGLTFKNGDINSVLNAIVYHGRDEITDTLANNAFIWRKFDKDGVHDTEWTNTHTNVGKQVIITNNDVFQRATFVCDIDASLLK